ncbi:response regulator [Dasania marina]|uniref:response regulator n=1 Tax=Dasania marina TaxID=471499 RepID=UPI0003726A6E|nr:response regulator [Dasania marina]
MDTHHNNAITSAAADADAHKADEGAVESLLLVDDNPINLQILYKTLERTGHRLHIAKDGETALAIAREVKPFLMLLDIMMPGMDGYEVCEALKSDPETAHIAVIFLSALEDSAAKVKGFAVGGVDYISKPFQADEVVARVRNHIKIHRLETELARRNSELESENVQILNAVSEGIIGLDKDGRIVMMNPAATAITAWPTADCFGEQLSAIGLFNSDAGHQVMEYQSLPYRSYYHGIAGHSDMEIIRRRDGERIPVAITCSPRPEGGAVVVLRDIREWVASEEALKTAREEVELERQYMAHMERLSTTGEMAAGIAHEVNQPLTAIVNYAQVAKRLMAADEFDKSKVEALLDKLNAQSVRASEVVQRMRSFVKKPEQGRRICDANDLMNDVLALAEIDSRVNDIPLHYEPDSSLPSVLADPVQIQQVVLNLIRNAMEACADQHSEDFNTLSSSVIVRAQLEGDKVRFSVIDSGIGIAQELRDKLFTPFFTTKDNGMGIGLAICQSIIQAHGGELSFRNNVEGGATFFFSLPSS